MVALIHASLDIISMTQYIVPTLELLNAKVDDNSGKKEFTQPIESIEFDHVCFKYPRNDDLILDDISFKINQGEKISLVGLNGAGKTTIVKLITRLYQPTSGRILINGEDIAQYEFNSYIKHISSVFQDFKLFAYSLKENILNADGDDKVAYDIACKVGLKEKIDSLPEGINSLYTKSYEENGIELSGGEAQKIAIARCINASSELVILDEPTSALDPLSEASIYENFNDLVQNKTALYISHRMSSSIFCDKIMVLDHGKIVDYDTHENLMKKKDGLYYRLFHEQAKNYAS
jgi:ATP-binding cassette subfamily B protein/ATP-binding cassette subfamily C protein